MKALTIIQPWATLIAVGKKEFETRSWQAPGSLWGQDIIIHAGKNTGDLYPLWNELRRLAKLGERPPFNGFHWHFVNAMLEVREDRIAHEDFPLGAAVAVATLVKCIPTEKLVGDISPREFAFGGYQPKRYGWQLTNVRRFVQPVYMPGQQGIFEVDIDPKVFEYESP